MQKIIPFYKKVFTTLLVFFTLIVGKNAFAVDKPQTSMFVSPMSQKIILVPGETYEGAVKVSNAATSIKDLSYIVDVESFSQKKDSEKNDDYGAVDLKTQTSRNEILKWITIDRKEGSIAPNNTDVVNFKIQVPEDAPAGAQYASIVFLDNTEYDNKGEGNITIESQVQLASIIYANVAGETIEKGSIKENSMPTILTTNTLEATSMVRNDGNIYTDASYTLQVWPMFSNEEICTNEEKAETSIILPDTERYHVQTCNLPMVGIYKAKQVVSIFGEQSVLEKTIFVCPIWLMILVLVIVIAIIIAIIVIIKKHSKKAED